jgi:Arylsulfotransferase (ASST)
MIDTDQQTRRRTTRTGLTALDKDRASLGYTLYAPTPGPGVVYLLDHEGKEVHRWELAYPPGLYGYLLPNGNLFYMGKIVGGTDFAHSPLFNLWNGGVLLEVDWDGGVVWEHRDENHHHDARRTSSGGATYLIEERVPDDVARKVRGGIPGTGTGGMYADGVVEVDAGGRRVWEWHAYEHLDFEKDVITSNDSRDEWTHANTVVPLESDHVLVSFRNISTVGIIDKKTGKFSWKLGYDVLSHQHDPSPLPGGNILVFDNGPHRRDITLPYSRVIEINPATNQIIWQYVDRPLYNFFSSFISGAQRLPNGITLITEGQFGRIFQVISGEVVWEYINPHFHQSPFGLVNSVFRARHYLPEEVPGLG